MRFASATAFLCVAALAPAQSDPIFAQKVKEYTTEPFFLTPLVDHQPLSSRIPSPDKILGHVIGAPNVLDYARDIHRYMRALEKATDRVKVVSMGKSEEGREMIAVLISDAANLRRLADIKSANARISDPRTLHSAADEQDAMKRAVPIYWATGGMHCPETGPPEMLAELAYRLAASEDPFIRDIRKNEIVMITPVLDVDGRERVVDLYRYQKANPKKIPIPLVYWGHYVAHDDNRDALTFRLSLSQAMMQTWLEYHPTVLHDLHESVPFLYISTGTGPYNAWLDPITIAEWQEMAYDEIDRMTQWGVPGIWTHDYYDGWSASYGFYVANGHNGIGRFYETFSGGGADTGIRSVGAESNRDWFRPNPPFPKVRWSIRDNINICESALLTGMHNVAVNRGKFLGNLLLKSKRSVAKASTEGPAAYVLPSPPGPGAYRVNDLMGVLSRQGVEVQRLLSPAKTKDGQFPTGSYVIRMDQPYSRMADMMLDSQYYKPSDPASYDDTGWQLGPLFDLGFVRVTDPAILTASMGMPPEDVMIPLPAIGNARVAMVHTWQSTQNDGWARIGFDDSHVPYKYVSVHELRDTLDLRAKYDTILIPQVGGSAQSIVNGVVGAGEPIPWKASAEYPNLGGPDSSDDIRGGIELSGMLNLQKFLHDGGTLICIGNACQIPVEYGLVSGVTIPPRGQLRAPGGVFKVEGDGVSPNLGVYFNSFSCPVLNAATRRNRDGNDTGPRSSGRGSLTDKDIIQGRPPYTPKAQPGDTAERDRFPDATVYPKVLLKFAPADKVLISGMIEHGEELGGKPALLECPVGKGRVLLFSFNPFWRGETVGSYDLVFRAIKDSAKP